MTVGSLLLSIALFLIVAVVIARPFFRPQRRPTPLSERELLKAQKEALLARLDALDFDAQTEKQDNEAYQAERRLIIEAQTEIDNQLANLKPEPVDRAIEAAVAALRQRQTAGEETPSPSSPRFCTQCGRPTTADDRYCAACGQELA